MSKTLVQPGSPPAKLPFRNQVFRDCRATVVPRDGSLPMERAEWLTVDEAAERIGRNRRFVYELGYNGSVLACKIGPSSLFYRRDVEKVRDWLEARRKEKEARAEEEARARAGSEKGLEAFQPAPPATHVVQLPPLPETVTVTRAEFEKFKRDVVCAINMLADSFSKDKKPRQMILQGLFTVNVNDKKGEKRNDDESARR